MRPVLFCFAVLFDLAIVSCWTRRRLGLGVEAEEETESLDEDDDVLFLRVPERRSFWPLAGMAPSLLDSSSSSSRQALLAESCKRRTVERSPFFRRNSLNDEDKEDLDEDVEESLSEESSFDVRL